MHHLELTLVAEQALNFSVHSPSAWKQTAGYAWEPVLLQACGSIWRTLNLSRAEDRLLMYAGSFEVVCKRPCQCLQGSGRSLADIPACWVSLPRWYWVVELVDRLSTAGFSDCTAGFSDSPSSLQYWHAAPYPVWAQVRAAGGYQAVEGSRGWMQVVLKCVQQLPADIQGPGLGSSSSLIANSSGHNNWANKGVQDSSSTPSSNASSSDAGEGSSSNINNRNSSSRHPLARPGWASASANGSCNAIEGARTTDLRPACMPQLDPTRRSRDGGAAAEGQPALGVAACLPADEGVAAFASEEVLSAGLQAVYKRFLLRLERKEAALLHCGLGGITVAPLVQLQLLRPEAAAAHRATAGALGAATSVPVRAAGAPVRQPAEAEDAKQAVVAAAVHERSSSCSGRSLPEMPHSRNSPDCAPTARPLASAFAALQLPPHLQPFSVRRTLSGPRGGRFSGTGRRMSARRRGGDSSSPPAPGEDAEATASLGAAETGSPRGTLGRAGSQLLQQVG